MKSQSPSRITRRELAGAVLATAAAAQTPPAAPATAEAELQATREQNQHTAEVLAKVRIPIATEPAFRFVA